MVTSHLLLWALVIIQAVVIVILVQQHAELRMYSERHAGKIVDPLPIGTKAPSFHAFDVHSQTVVSSERWYGRRIIMLFLSAECSLCKYLAAELAAMPRVATPNLLVYCDASPERTRDFLAGLSGSATVITSSDSDVAASFRLRGFPVAIEIDDRWKIAGFRYPTSATQLFDEPQPELSAASRREVA